MEFVVAGAVTVGFVALDEGVKHLCRNYLNHNSKKSPEVR